MNKKELFAIPNVMGYFRLLVLPVFAYIYLTADTKSDYIISAVLIGVSGATDFLDGFIARKFNMITELGKFLDPFADKMTQGIIIICLSFRYRLLIPVLCLFVLKELVMMGIMGLYIYKKKGVKLGGAMWFGKVCTAVLYLVMAILLISPAIDNFSMRVANIMIIVVAVLLLFSFIRYIPIYIKMWRENKNIK